MRKIFLLVKNVSFTKSDVMFLCFSIWLCTFLWEQTLPLRQGAAFETGEWIATIVFSIFIMGGFLVPIIGIWSRTVDNYHKALSLKVSFPKGEGYIFIGNLVDRIRLVRFSYVLLFISLFYIALFVFFESSGLLTFIVFSCLIAGFLLVGYRVVNEGVWVFVAALAFHLLLIYLYRDTPDFHGMIAYSLVSAALFLLVLTLYLTAGKEVPDGSENSFFNLEQLFWRSAKERSLLSWFKVTFIAVHNPSKTYAWFLLSFLVVIVSLVLAMYFDNYWLIFLAIFSVRPFIKAKEIGRPEALDALKFDERQPVLLLRSFTDDGHCSVQSSLRFEDMIVPILNKLGTTVCIGDPREESPLPGAYRTYIREDNDDSWQTLVKNWMEASQLIILVAGSTHFLGWELGQLQQKLCLPKTIIVMPPEMIEERGERWEIFLNYLQPLYPDIDLFEINFMTLLAIVHKSDGSPVFIHSATNTKTDYTFGLKAAIGMQGLRRRLGE